MLLISNLSIDKTTCLVTGLKSKKYLLFTVHLRFKRYNSIFIRNCAFKRYTNLNVYTIFHSPLLVIKIF